MSASGEVRVVNYYYISLLFIIYYYFNSRPTWQRLSLPSGAFEGGQLGLQLGDGEASEANALLGVQ